MPSELRRQRDPNRSRLNDGEAAVQPLRAAAGISGDSARITQILEIQRRAVLIVVDSQTRAEGIVAGQFDLHRHGLIAAEVALPRSHITPGAAGKIFEVRKRSPVVLAVERGA